MRAASRSLFNFETTIRGCARALLRLGDSKARRSPTKNGYENHEKNQKLNTLEGKQGSRVKDIKVGPPLRV